MDRDDAINEGDKLNSQRFKTIVTGEPVDIEIKHRHAVPSHRFELPVCLTCNSLPKAIDGSDADLQLFPDLANGEGH